MIQTLILGLIQGLTEFLPVSSSGHLILIPSLLKWRDQGLEMDVALHAGTLMAVCLYFWRDLWSMTKSFFCWQWDSSTQLVLALIVATLPVTVLGFALKQLTTIRTPWMIALVGIIFGLLLYGVDRWSTSRRQMHDMTWQRAFWIGLAQAIALFPGVSRSGISMTAARFLGFDRESAAKFSFLLSIPAILGAVTLTTVDVIRLGSPIDLVQTAWGILFSFLSGLFAIHGLMLYLKKHSFLPFMIYRIILGIAILILL